MNDESGQAILRKYASETADRRPIHKNSASPMQHEHSRRFSKRRRFVNFDGNFPATALKSVHRLLNSGAGLRGNGMHQQIKQQNKTAPTTLNQSQAAHNALRTARRTISVVQP